MEFGFWWTGVILYVFEDGGCQCLDMWWYLCDVIAMGGLGVVCGIALWFRVRGNDRLLFAM